MTAALGMVDRCNRVALKCRAISPERKLTMADRDVDRNCSAEEFAGALRRLADALEKGDAYRIQVAGKRFSVPKDAQLVIEHEAEGENEELAFELRWKRHDD